MTDDIQDFAALTKRVDTLKELLGLLGGRVRLIEDLQAKALEDLRKELDLIHKNQRFLYELVSPVFKQMFPNDWKYRIEFDRILGTMPKDEQITPKKDV